MESQGTGSTFPADFCQGYLAPLGYMALLDKIYDSSSLPFLLKEPTVVPQERVRHPLSQRSLGMQAMFNILLSSQQLEPSSFGFFTFESNSNEHTTQGPRDHVSLREHLFLYLK